MTKKAFITVGISASGKTFWAKQQKGFTIICRDDCRRSILENRLNRKLENGELWGKWKFKDEHLVNEMVDRSFEQICVNAGWNVIFADTNLNVGRRDALKKKLEDHGYEVEVIVFDISYEDAVKRDNARPDGVGQSVIMKQWLQYQEMRNFGEKYHPTPGSRKAIMVDLDGTLCLMKDRGPFEWSKVGQDDLNSVVYHIVRGFYQQGYEIVIMSGRDSVCRKETEDWLVKHNVPYTELHMRKENDMRKDNVVKNELFWANVAQRFDVECVVDDRPQVLREWIKIGLKTVAIGNPFIEF